MIAEKLPRKGAARIDTTGLQKRPQFEQILNYLTYGQENIVYPDREAKLVRNHPFMTQLDFFDMQEDQKNQWEEQKRQHEVEVIAEKFGMSTASVRAMGTQTGKTRTSDTQSQTNGTQNASSGTQTDGTQNTSSGTQPGKRTNTGGSQTERASSSTQHPVYTVYNDSRVSGTHPSMQGGVTYRPTVSTVPHFQDGWQGPGSSSGPPPPATVAAAAVASTLALQEQGITDTVTHMDMDARKRLSEAKEQIGARRQAMQQQIGTMLAQPVPQAAAAPSATKPVYDQQMDPAALKRLTGDEGEGARVKRQPDPFAVMRLTGEETEGARVKRQVEQHVGEVVSNIPFLNTSADVMDARATVMQENARIAEIAIVDTVTNNSSDFDGLAKALGETAPHEVIPVASAPQQFNIATPRERSPRGIGRGRGNKNTVSGALAAIAAEKQTAPENVDAGIAPVARKRTGRHGPRLTADQKLDIMLGQNNVKQQAGRLTIQDGEPDLLRSRSRSRGQLALGDGSAMTRRDMKKRKIEEAREKQKQIFTNETKTKAIVAQDAPRPTEKAPKLANESSTEEVKEKTTEMPPWSKLKKKQIVDKILELFGNAKTSGSLMAMTKANLVNYAQNKGSVQVDKADKLVKTTTLKPGKSRARNKGVTA